MTSKQDKLRNRERKIVDVSCQMIIAEGFFNLRMSDVAQKAEISVGTLYVHFESKEDLLMGIAINALHERYELFKRVQEKYENPVLRLSAMLICDHILNQQIGEISEIERLAQFPSVWKRASYRRMEEMKLLCKMIGDFVRLIIEEAMASGNLTAENKEANSISTCINASAWGVCVGMHHVFNSYCVKSEQILTANDIKHAYVEAVHALLRGFGYTKKKFKDRLYEIFEELELSTKEFKKNL